MQNLETWSSTEATITFTGRWSVAPGIDFLAVCATTIAGSNLAVRGRPGILDS